MIRVFKAKIGVLRSLTFPITLIWHINLSFEPRGLLCLMLCILQLSTAMIPPKITQSENRSL
jgi:hypothetical protein